MKTIARKSSVRKITNKWKRTKCPMCNTIMRVIYINQHYYYKKQKKKRLIRVGILCLGCKNVILDNFEKWWMK